MTIEADCPDQVISICGLSCVGKGTLIDKIYLDQEGVRDRFGIPAQPDFFASRSTSRSGKTGYRKLSEKGQVTKEMFRSPRSNLIVFRWQIKQDAVIDQLLGWFPGSRHRIVVLWRPWEDQVKDLSRVFDKRTSVDSQKRLWASCIDPRFGPTSDFHRHGVEITLVDASDPAYPETTWPRC